MSTTFPHQYPQAMVGLRAPTFDSNYLRQLVSPLDARWEFCTDRRHPRPPPGPLPNGLLPR